MQPERLRENCRPVLAAAHALYNAIGTEVAEIELIASRATGTLARRKIVELTRDGDPAISRPTFPGTPERHPSEKRE